METQAKLGTKDTKEVIIAAGAITPVIIKVAKDGIQLAKDSETIYSEIIANAEVKAKVLAAIEGIKNVGAELKDLDTMEAVELVYEGGKQALAVAQALKA